MSYDFTEEHKDKHEGWPASWIRRGCFDCGDDSMDGISEAKLDQATAMGWSDIEYKQSYDNATLDDEEYEKSGFARGKNFGDFSLMDWWTHLGFCPKCSGSTRQADARAEAKRAAAQITGNLTEEN